MTVIFRVLSLMALVSIAAAFGFFYAWSVSAMWGLDAVRPEVAIEAMNGVNGIVQNGAFALSFFGAPVLLALACLAGFVARERGRALVIGVALAVCLLCVHVITFTYHIPLNRDLMTETGPFEPGVAEAIWTAYSADWKFWNWVRTVGSGLSVLLVGIGLVGMGRDHAA